MFMYAWQISGEYLHPYPVTIGFEYEYLYHHEYINNYTITNLKIEQEVVKHFMVILPIGNKTAEFDGGNKRWRRWVVWK